jgi:hypothetical protein
MFMRNRPRPRVRENRPISRPDTTSPQAIERSIVLRGVAIEDNELHAYLENSRTGQRFRVAPGDTLASGRVFEIAIDAIAYEADGRTAWIEIGQNLSGGRAEASISSRSGRSVSGGYGNNWRGNNGGVNNGDSNGNANPAAQPPDDVAATEGMPPEEPASPSPSASSLEERMKQRRLQQRGGGK